jgi:HAD superfamily hydrolase (TIGR01509 family)
VIEAVVFDLDGVLLDSEGLWDLARREVARDHGGRWTAEATKAMQGMSSREWGHYMRTSLGVPLDESRIVDLVVGRLLEEYGHRLPLLPGALEAVARLGERWPLGLASSSNRVVINQVLELAGMKAAFTATVSSEEVPRGKPAPDVYLAVSDRMHCSPASSVAVEDSANGIRSAAAAGFHVIAVPNRDYPPPAELLRTVGVVIPSLDELTANAVEALDVGRRPVVEDRIDEQEVESFPASDPHSDWAGPPE